MRKIVVVEGKHDYQKIKQIAPDIAVITTNGCDVSTELLKRIDKLSEENEVFLLLNPDPAGERIREKIAAKCKNIRHVFVRKDDAISKDGRKIGVEHADLRVLQEILSDLRNDCHDGPITDLALYELGLIGGSGSREKRIKLCERLKIGYANGKQLARRLNLYGISLEQVREILCSET